MVQRVTRIKSLSGINSIELERRLGILENNKEKVIGWLNQANPALRKHEIRSRLIELLELDTGAMSTREAAATAVRAYSSLFYCSSLGTVEEYDSVSKRLIDILGDYAEVFLREKGASQNKRGAYAQRNSDRALTGVLVPVLNGSYVEVKTVESDLEPEQVQKPTPTAEKELLDSLLISEPTHADVDLLLETLLLSISSAPDSKDLFSSLTSLHTDLRLDNPEISVNLAEALIKFQPAKKFLNRLRLNLLMKQ